MDDNKINFWINNNPFEIDRDDQEILNAAILEFTEVYTIPVIFEDSILYAPFESDRDKMYMKHGGYRRFLIKHSKQVKEVIKTIKQLTNVYRGNDACAA